MDPSGPRCSPRWGPATRIWLTRKQKSERKIRRAKRKNGPHAAPRACLRPGFRKKRLPGSLRFPAIAGGNLPFIRFSATPRKNVSVVSCLFSVFGIYVPMCSLFARCEGLTQRAHFQAVRAAQQIADLREAKKCHHDIGFGPVFRQGHFLPNAALQVATSWGGSCPIVVSGFLSPPRTAPKTSNTKTIKPW